MLGDLPRVTQIVNLGIPNPNFSSDFGMYALSSLPSNLFYYKHLYLYFKVSCDRLVLKLKT